MLCHDCEESSLIVSSSDKNDGFVNNLVLLCANCENIGIDCEKKNMYASKRIDQTSNNHSDFDLNMGDRMG